MISDIFAKLSPGGGQGLERLPTQQRKGNFELADINVTQSENISSSERRRINERQEAIRNLIEQHTMLDTVDDIYKKAKIQS